MIVKNEELAYATLDYIREHPKEWDQKNYLCGTTACFAGRALLLSGVSRTMGENSFWLHPAQEALGWTYEEAKHVFWLQTTDFAELEAAVKRVLNGEIY